MSTRTIRDTSWQGATGPGLKLALFGMDLGPQVPVPWQLTPDGNAITNILSDTRVLFDGKPAPLLAVSSGQINTIVPSAVAQQRLTEVKVEYKGELSGPVMLPVASARPGILTADQSGKGQGAILSGSDSSFNGPSSPAARGSVVLVFGTSGGPTVPACEDGLIVPEARPLQLSVTASIGGVPATVIYAGAAPTLVTGVLQFNIQIPDGAPTGDAVPLVVSVGGAQSQDGVTLAIR